METNYDKVRGELHKVFSRKRNKRSHPAALKVVEGCELVLSKFGFHPVKEGGVVWTDGTVYAHISLCQKFNGEWVADAWIVTRPSSVKLYRDGKARNSKTDRASLLSKPARKAASKPRRTEITEGDEG